MTLYFKDITAIGTTNTKICVDIAQPFPKNRYRLQLTSRYTNRDVDNNTTEWLFPMDLLFTNERYSEFNVEPYVGTGDTVQTGLYSGIYDYKIWGTNFNTDYETDPFNEDVWTLLQEGQTKVKSTTTVDMQRGSDENITVKYKTEPNKAQSYVIYK